MASRPSARMVQTIPKADFKSSKKLDKKLKSARWKEKMSYKDSQAFAKLIGSIRAGQVSMAKQEAIYGESMALLRSTKKARVAGPGSPSRGLENPFHASWAKFFKKHGGESLVSVDFNEFDRPWIFLPFPSVKQKKGKAEAKFNFLRKGGEVLADIHLTDKRGEYVGTVRKAVAPDAPLISGKKDHRRAVEMQTRMIVAGLQRHAKDLLGESLGIDPDTLIPEDSGWDLNAAMTEVAVLRGQPVFLDFRWPKGIVVRTLMGQLNRERREPGWQESPVTRGEMTLEELVSGTGRLQEEAEQLRRAKREGYFNWARRRG